MSNRNLILFTILFISLVFFACISLCFGSVQLSFGEIINALFKNNGGELSENILFKLRLPRIISAIVLGGGLAVSGYLLQTFFSNPIAGPFVLGISSGAKLTVALTMILSLEMNFLLNSAMLITSAFIGAMASMGFILLMSKKVQNSSMLIVGGIMIGYICSAITDFAVTFADESNIVNLHNWSMGSFNTKSSDIPVMCIVIFVTTAICLLISKQINAYQLGEEYARSVGVNIPLFRIGLITISSLLSACVTAFAGPVSFVGIATPHLIRGMFKTSKPQIIIPAVFLGGGVFCVVCDLIARIAFAPVELNISTVTSFFGAPIVICIMIKRKR